MVADSEGIWKVEGSERDPPVLGAGGCKGCPGAGQYLDCAVQPSAFWSMTPHHV